MNLQQLESRRVETLMELLHRAAQHIPSAKTAWKPEGRGKSAHELVEHLAGANHAFASLIRGDHLAPGASTTDRQQIKVPADDYAQALDLLQASGQVLAKAIASVPDDQLGQQRPMPWGETWKVTRLLTAPSAHIAYHWGQLCYLQTLWGDLKDYHFSG